MTPRMKLLHVVPSYIPAWKFGGPIRSVHGLCRALAARGHNVEVFTTPVGSDTKGSREEKLDGVRVRYFSCPAWGRRFYFSPQMQKALMGEVSAFQIVHAHSVFLWPTAAAARAAVSARKPFVLSPRGMLVKDLIRRKSFAAKNLWIRFIETRNMENADCVHVTSELEKEELGRFSFRVKEIAVIPNGIEEMSDGEDAALPVEIADAPFILFVGRVHWKKGLDRLVEAMGRLPHLRLAVVGNDEENYRPELEKIARRFGAEGRVFFTGSRDGAEKNALYRRATALVLPSYSENFGNVVLEAMACGCPAIVTPEVGLADVVRSSGAGLVSDGRPEALADAIQLIASDTALARAMGERGRIAAERFRWSSVAERMEALYRRLLERKSG